MNIQQAIRTLAQSNAEVYCKICRVDKVYPDARTVDVQPIDKTAPIYNVNLQADQQSTIGVVLWPAEKSYVVVAFINDAAGVVVLTEQIERIELKIGEDNPVEGLIEEGAVKLAVGKTTVEVAPDKEITFNGGGMGGLVKIEELRKSLDSLKSYCETLKTAISAGIAAVGKSTAADGGAGQERFDKAMASAAIKIENMENTKIKHGE